MYYSRTNESMMLLQRSGAIAVLVVDDERELCTAFNQRCMAGADKSKGERFAVHDHSKAW
jgi:hypothetical protein